MDVIDSELYPMTGISSVEIPIFVVTRQLLVLILEPNLPGNHDVGLQTF
jgi:hypothetical protein